MPEQHVSDFPAITDGMKTGDVLHMQRLVGADWVDYKLGTYGTYGDNWQTAIYTREVTDPTVTVVATPGAGQIHIVGRCYAVWHPGTTNDNLDLEVRIQGLGTTTGYNGVIKTGAVANANTVYTQLTEDVYLAAAPLQLLHSTTSTSDGTYTVFIQYMTVPFPS